MFKLSCCVFENTIKKRRGGGGNAEERGATLRTSALPQRLSAFPNSSPAAITVQHSAPIAYYLDLHIDL